MCIPRIFLVLLPLSALLAGCSRLGSPELEVETFTLEHRSGHEAADLVGPYIYTDRGENPGAFSVTREAITVRETRDNLEKIARVLEDFDRPLPGVTLYFQLIEADSFQEEDPAIADVVQELRSLFRFQGYRLLGETVVPVAGGTGDLQMFNQRFMGVDNPIMVEAGVRVFRNGTIRLDPVQLRDTWNELMATSVNVKPGQTIVIGGTQARTETDEGRPYGSRALIFTVRAEES